MAKAYQEGKGWSVRVRIRGRDIYLSGYPSAAAARAAAVAERVAIEKGGQPKKLGPHRTSVGVAFMDYARERLPFQKGARQEAQRMNQYLRACGLPIIHLEDAHDVAEGGACYWRVSFEEECARTIPNSLKSHRAKQSRKGKKTDLARRYLARKLVADVMAYDVQLLLDGLRKDGYAPATIGLERAQLRRLFNYAKHTWKWAQPSDNPAGKDATVPEIKNGRERVLTNKEWAKLCEQFESYPNPYVGPAFALLLETAMRSSEPLRYATWSCVDWDRCVLHLSNAKAGARDVPLTPGAIEILQGLRTCALEAEKTYRNRKAGVTLAGPQDRILPTSYEALKKAWNVCCAAIGLADVNVHDLRHTAATRFAIEYHGNIPVLKIITGHKTDAQLMRYVNLKTDDVVRMMHGKSQDVDEAPARHVMKGAEEARDTDEAVMLSAVPPTNVVRIDFARRSA